MNTVALETPPLPAEAPGLGAAPWPSIPVNGTVYTVIAVDKSRGWCAAGASNGWIFLSELGEAWRPDNIFTETAVEDSNNCAPGKRDNALVKDTPAESTKLSPTSATAFGRNCSFGPRSVKKRLNESNDNNVNSNVTPRSENLDEIPNGNDAVAASPAGDLLNGPKHPCRAEPDSSTTGYDPQDRRKNNDQKKGGPRPSNQSNACPRRLLHAIPKIACVPESPSGGAVLGLAFCAWPQPSLFGINYDCVLVSLHEDGILRYWALDDGRCLLLVPTAALLGERAVFFSRLLLSNGTETAEMNTRFLILGSRAAAVVFDTWARTVALILFFSFTSALDGLPDNKFTAVNTCPVLPLALLLQSASERQCRRRNSALMLPKPHESPQKELQLYSQDNPRIHMSPRRDSDFFHPAGPDFDGADASDAEALHPRVSRRILALLQKQPFLVPYNVHLVSVCSGFEAHDGAPPASAITAVPQGPAIITAAFSDGQITIWDVSLSLQRWLRCAHFETFPPSVKPLTGSNQAIYANMDVSPQSMSFTETMLPEDSVPPAYAVAALPRMTSRCHAGEVAAVGLCSSFARLGTVADESIAARLSGRSLRIAAERFRGPIAVPFNRSASNRRLSEKVSDDSVAALDLEGTESSVARKPSAMDWSFSVGAPADLEKLCPTGNAPILPIPAAIEEFTAEAARRHKVATRKTRLRELIQHEEETWAAVRLVKNIDARLCRALLGGRSVLEKKESGINSSSLDCNPCDKGRALREAELGLSHKVGRTSLLVAYTTSGRIFLLWKTRLPSRRLSGVDPSASSKSAISAAVGETVAACLLSIVPKSWITTRYQDSIPLPSIFFESMNCTITLLGVSRSKPDRLSVYQFKGQICGDEADIRSFWQPTFEENTMALSDLFSAFCKLPGPSVEMPVPASRPTERQHHITWGAAETRGRIFLVCSRADGHLISFCLNPSAPRPQLTGDESFSKQNGRRHSIDSRNEKEEAPKLRNQSSANAIPVTITGSKTLDTVLQFPLHGSPPPYVHLLGKRDKRSSVIEGDSPARSEIQKVEALDGPEQFSSRLEARRHLRSYCCSRVIYPRNPPADLRYYNSFAMKRKNSGNSHGFSGEKGRRRENSRGPEGKRLIAALTTVGNGCVIGGSFTGDVMWWLLPKLRLTGSIPGLFGNAVVGLLPLITLDSSGTPVADSRTSTSSVLCIDSTGAAAIINIDHASPLKSCPLYSDAPASASSFVQGPTPEWKSLDSKPRERVDTQTRSLMLPRPSVNVSLFKKWSPLSLMLSYTPAVMPNNGEAGKEQQCVDQDGWFSTWSSTLSQRRNRDSNMRNASHHFGQSLPAAAAGYPVSVTYLPRHVKLRSPSDLKRAVLENVSNTVYIFTSTTILAIALSTQPVCRPEISLDLLAARVSLLTLKYTEDCSNMRLLARHLYPGGSNSGSYMTQLLPLHGGGPLAVQEHSITGTENVESASGLSNNGGGVIVAGLNVPLSDSFWSVSPIEWRTRLGLDIRMINLGSMSCLRSFKCTPQLPVLILPLARIGSFSTQQRLRNEQPNVAPQHLQSRNFEIKRTSLAKGFLPPLLRDRLASRKNSNVAFQTSSASCSNTANNSKESFPQSVALSFLSSIADIFGLFLPRNILEPLLSCIPRQLANNARNVLFGAYSCRLSLFPVVLGVGNSVAFHIPAAYEFFLSSNDGPAQSVAVQNGALQRDNPVSMTVSDLTLLTTTRKYTFATCRSVDRELNVAITTNPKLEPSRGLQSSGLFRPPRKSIFGCHRDVYATAVGLRSHRKRRQWNWNRITIDVSPVRAQIDKDELVRRKKISLRIFCTDHRASPSRSLRSSPQLSPPMAKPFAEILRSESAHSSQHFVESGGLIKTPTPSDQRSSSAISLGDNFPPRKASGLLSFARKSDSNIGEAREGIEGNLQMQPNLSLQRSRSVVFRRKPLSDNSTDSLVQAQEFYDHQDSYDLPCSQDCCTDTSAGFEVQLERNFYPAPKDLSDWRSKGLLTSSVIVSHLTGFLPTFAGTVMSSYLLALYTLCIDSIVIRAAELAAGMALDTDSGTATTKFRTPADSSDIGHLLRSPLLSVLRAQYPSLLATAVSILASTAISHGISDELRSIARNWMILTASAAPAEQLVHVAAEMRYCLAAYERASLEGAINRKPKRRFLAVSPSGAICSGPFIAYGAPMRLALTTIAAVATQRPAALFRLGNPTASAELIARLLITGLRSPYNVPPALLPSTSINRDTSYCVDDCFTMISHLQFLADGFEMLWRPSLFGSSPDNVTPSKKLGTPSFYEWTLWASEISRAGAAADAAAGQQIQSIPTEALATETRQTLPMDTIEHVYAVIFRIFALTAVTELQAYATSFLSVIGQAYPLRVIRAMGLAARRLDLGPQFIMNALLVIIRLVTEQPLLCLKYLSQITISVVRCLDPANPALRRSTLSGATAVLFQLVRIYPMISFHQASQRLAVGNADGAIIVFDLRTATKWRVFEGHIGPVSVLGFTSEGAFLASYCIYDQTFCLWQCSSPGFLGGILGSGSKCHRLLRLPRTAKSQTLLPTDQLSTMRVISKSSSDWILKREDGKGYAIRI